MLFQLSPISYKKSILLIFFTLITILSPLRLYATALVSAAISEEISLIHIIRKESAVKWSEKFLDEYIKNGVPPADWFHLGIWGGVMVVPIPRIVNLSQVSVEELLRNSWFYRNSNEDVIQQAKDEVIVFVMNPKKDSIWMMGLGSSDKDIIKLQRDWWFNPTNWFRKNQFSSEFVKNIKKNWRLNIKHSEIYSDYNIIGHIHDPVGDLYMTSGVVTNSNMLESSKIFIPQKYTKTNTRTDIYKAPSLVKCSIYF